MRSAELCLSHPRYFGFLFLPLQLADELLVGLVSFVGQTTQIPPKSAIPVDRHVSMGAFAYFAVVAEVGVLVEAEPLVVAAVLRTLGKQID